MFSGNPGVDIPTDEKEAPAATGAGQASEAQSATPESAAANAQDEGDGTTLDADEGDETTDAIASPKSAADTVSQTDDTLAPRSAASS